MSAILSNTTTILTKATNNFSLQPLPELRRFGTISVNSLSKNGNGGSSTSHKFQPPLQRTNLATSTRTTKSLLGCKLKHRLSEQSCRTVDFGWFSILSKLMDILLT